MGKGETWVRLDLVGNLWLRSDRVCTNADQDKSAAEIGIEKSCNERALHQEFVFGKLSSPVTPA
jgi:hypothetical protein